jgi:tetratricopeptide (TPR) repeat protein
VAQRAQRRRQKRLVFGTLGTLLLALFSWQVYEYISSAPQRAAAQVQAAMSMLTPGRYEQAVTQFSEALQTDPTSWNAYLQRGVAKQNLGMLDEALEDYRNALVLKPDLLQARTERAEIYRQKGEQRHAVEELSKVIELNPTIEAYSTRALIYAEMGQHEQAIPDFTWVINQTRDAPFAYFGRAKSKRALGDEAGAVADEQAAAGLDRGRVN